MSTRALYTFRDADAEFHVYKHYDGYPSGALDAIRRMAPHAWPLPRFEADEAAAAFIAGNKSGPGDVRLLPTGDWKAIAPADIEYRYAIHRPKAPGAMVAVEGWSVDHCASRATEWRQRKILGLGLQSLFAMPAPELAEYLASKKAA